MAKEKKEKKVFPALIDITNKEQLKNLDFNALIDDANERGDVEALTWLMKRNKETEVRHSVKGKEFTVGASFLITKNTYLADYLGWVPEKETATPAPTLEQVQAEREQKIKDAIAKASAAAVAAANSKKK